MHANTRTEISLEFNLLFPKEQLMDYDKCPTAFPSAVLKWKWKVNFPKWILNGCVYTFLREGERDLLRRHLGLLWVCSIVLPEDSKKKLS